METHPLPISSSARWITLISSILTLLIVFGHHCSTFAQDPSANRVSYNRFTSYAESLPAFEVVVPILNQWFGASRRWPTLLDPHPYSPFPAFTRLIDYRTLMQAIALTNKKIIPSAEDWIKADLEAPLIEHEFVSTFSAGQSETQALILLKEVARTQAEISAKSGAPWGIEVSASLYVLSNSNWNSAIRRAFLSLSAEEQAEFKKYDDRDRSLFFQAQGPRNLLLYKKEIETALAWDLILSVLGEFDESGTMDQSDTIVETLRTPHLLAKHIPTHWDLNTDQDRRTIARLLKNRIESLMDHHIGRLRIPHPTETMTRNWRFRLIQVPVWLAMLRGFPGNDCSSNQCTYSPLHPEETVYFIEDASNNSLLGYVQIRNVKVRAKNGSSSTEDSAVLVHSINGLGVQGWQVKPILGALSLILKGKSLNSLVLPTAQEAIRVMMNRIRIQKEFLSHWDGTEVEMKPTRPGIWRAIRSAQPKSVELSKSLRTGIQLSALEIQNLENLVQYKGQFKSHFQSSDSIPLFTSDLKRSSKNEIHELFWHLEFSRLLNAQDIQDRTIEILRSTIVKKVPQLVLSWLHLVFQHADLLGPKTVTSELIYLGLTSAEGVDFSYVLSVLRAIDSIDQRAIDEALNDPSTELLVVALKDDLPRTIAQLNEIAHQEAHIRERRVVAAALGIVFSDWLDRAIQKSQSQPWVDHFKRLRISLDEAFPNNSLYFKPTSQWPGPASTHSRICKYLTDRGLALRE